MSLDTDANTDAVNREPSELEKFIQAFSYQLITVSVQKDKEVVSPLGEGKYFSPVNRIRALTYRQFVDAQLELMQAQLKGYGIYFMVNEGDGKPATESDNLNCGKRTNVKTLTSLFIDTDEADAKLLMQKLTEMRLPPHIIVTTSPNRYHFYFLIERTPAEGESILYWKALQKKLASLVPGLDQSMSDINQVLRLPSFKNLKRDKPFDIKLFRFSNHTPYNLKFTFDRTGSHEFLDDVSSLYSANGHASNGTNGTYKKYEFPTAPLPPGSRRNAICSYIEHLMENVVPLSASENDFYPWVNNFIREYLRPEDQPDFLPGGKRRKNIEDYYNQQKEYRIRKKQIKDSQVAIKEFDHQSAVEDNVLPDSFYVKFPGDLGMLTREIFSFNPGLSLELCFAGALCISGALKAETFRLHGYWPLVNGLVIASTGAGKSTLIHVIEEAFRLAGLSGKFPQFIRHQSTVQSLHSNLYAAGGVGTTVVDEAGDYIQAITSNRAPVWMQDLKAYYKKATTGRAKGVNLSPGGSKANMDPPIIGGFLSLWMFIQPDKFSGNLSLEDMRDGFLPRFLVFKGKTDMRKVFTLDAESLGAETFEPSMDMRVWIESLTKLMNFASDDSVLAAVEEAEALYKAETKRPTKDGIRAAQVAAIHRLRAEARQMGPKVTGCITEDAMNCLRAYMQEWDKKAIEIQKANELDPALDIFVRIREMVFRLLCNAMPGPRGMLGLDGKPLPGYCSPSVSDNSSGAGGVGGGDMSGVIDLELMEAVIKFHRFQTERFLRNELEEMGADHEIRAVVQAVYKASKKKGGESVTAKEVMQSFMASRRPKHVSFYLKEAASRGEIAIEERPHAFVKEKKVTVYRPLPSEDLQQPA